MRQHRLELGFRSETIRRANLSAIVRELHFGGPLSRSELGARTGLTRSAIRLLIGELASAGLVREANGAAVGTPGRPSAMVRLQSHSAAVLSLEITVDSLAAVVVGLGGRVLRHERVERPREAFSVEQMTTELIGLVDRIGARRDPPAPIVGIGVGIAGIVRRDEGVVAIAPNLDWHEIPFGPILSDALQMNLPLWIANEADLGALAEHRRGVAAGFDDVLYISGEVGVGGGLIIGGKQMAGAAGYGGEVGHHSAQSGRRGLRLRLRWLLGDRDRRARSAASAPDIRWMADHRRSTLCCATQAQARSVHSQRWTTSGHGLGAASRP